MTLYIYKTENEETHNRSPLKCQLSEKNVEIHQGHIYMGIILLRKLTSECISRKNVNLRTVLCKQQLEESAGIKAAAHGRRRRSETAFSIY